MCNSSLKNTKFFLKKSAIGSWDHIINSLLLTTFFPYVLIATSYEHTPQDEKWDKDARKWVYYSNLYPHNIRVAIFMCMRRSSLLSGEVPLSTESTQSSRNIWIFEAESMVKVSLVRDTVRPSQYQKGLIILENNLDKIIK